MKINHIDWEFVACVTLAVLLIALCVLIFFSLVRHVKQTMISVSKLIMLVGAVAFILCGLLPPWLDISNQGHTRATAYSFILSPPPTKEYSYGVKIDISRLVVEWLCILAVTAVAWIIFVPKSIKEPKQEAIKPPAKD